MADDILTRAAGRIATTLKRDARTVEGVAVSGYAPAIRDPRYGDPDPAGDGRPWVEEIDPAGCDLAAFRGLPLLLDHRPITSAAVGTVRERAQGEDLAALKAIDRSKLTRIDQLAYDVFRNQAEINLRGYAPAIQAVDRE